MKIKYKKSYEAPVTEIISADMSPVMYQTSIPQAGEDEEGGGADAKQGPFSEENEAWPSYDPWGD
ncbi:MAG: hypothetical protein ACTTHE_08045 [Prevotella multiformis]|uniref:hypothetical protein n=1 Tax=Prevotella multiformis TaxID=282402 RepID=UPI001BAD4A91|nr:hypothetical protein [Prevotella multiformis]QUB72196.1 hypothetical protein J4864_08730 [Prevotella multiformis]